jgi:hypothetical protein
MHRTKRHPSFDHLVGAGKQRRGKRDAQRLGGLDSRSVAALRRTNSRLTKSIHRFPYSVKT